MLKSRKTVLFVLLIVLCAGFMGCMTTRVGGDAHLAPSDTEGTLIAEKGNWYILWGLVPLNDNRTDAVVPAGKKVRVETKYTPIDFLINIFTGLVTIYTNTAEVYEVK